MVDSPRKKDGEKSLLLHACGECLFGCAGETKVTQGVYVYCNKKFDCFCKRAVWFPCDFSASKLKEKFDAFGASLPPGLNDSSVVGLCGKNPTRTARAIDSTFMVLIPTMKKKLSCFAIVSIDIDQYDCDDKPVVTINKISTDTFDINDTIEWIRRESKEHMDKAKKRPRETHVAIPNSGYIPIYSDGHGIFSQPLVLTNCFKKKAEPMTVSALLNHEIPAMEPFQMQDSLQSNPKDSAVSAPPPARSSIGSEFKTESDVSSSPEQIPTPVVAQVHPYPEDLGISDVPVDVNNVFNFYNSNSNSQPPVDFNGLF